MESEVLESFISVSCTLRSNSSRSIWNLKFSNHLSVYLAPGDLILPGQYGTWSSLLSQLFKVLKDLKLPALYYAWSPKISSSIWYLEFQKYTALYGTWSPRILSSIQYLEFQNTQFYMVPGVLEYPALYGTWSSRIPSSIWYLESQNTQLYMVPGVLEYPALYGTWSPRIPSYIWYLEFSNLLLVCNQKRDKPSKLVYPGGIRELCQGYSLKLSEILRVSVGNICKKNEVVGIFLPIPKTKR